MKFSEIENPNVIEAIYESQINCSDYNILYF